MNSPTQTEPPFKLAQGVTLVAFVILGTLAARSKLILPADAELTDSWRSTTFGEKHPSPMLRVHRHCRLPLRLHTRIDLSH